MSEGMQDNQWEMVLEVWDSMTHRSQAPDEVACDAAVRACKAGRQQARLRSVLQDMVDYGSADTDGKTGEALWQLRRYEERLPPKQAACLTAIHELVRAGLEDEAIEAYRMAVAEGLHCPWQSDVSIDLHGLTVNAARVALRVAVESVLSRPRDLFLVVGQGRETGGSVIKGTFITHLRGLGLEVVEVDGNPGVLYLPAEQLQRLKGPLTQL